MVEIFKTNVHNTGQAKHLLDLIHRNFTGYKANFDLEDCDCILRVSNPAGTVETEAVIIFLENEGISAEVL